MFNHTDRVIKKILRKIDNEVFSTSLLNEMNCYLNIDGAEVKTIKNSISVKCQNKQFLVTLELDGVSYEVKKENGSIMHYEKCLSHKKGSVIKVLDQKESIIDLGNQLYFDKINEETFRLFDRRGIETSKRCSKKVDNYYYDKETKEKTLCEPGPFQNYTESVYTWRIESNYVIKRIIRSYPYSNETKASCFTSDSDDFLIRYQLLSEKQKELPQGGHYYGIDSDVFFAYKQNNASIDDVVENFKSKKYAIPNTIYI